MQQLLKEDVLNTTDELLARAAGVADSDELASLYRAQLLHVTDQVRRLGGVLGLYRGILPGSLSVFLRNGAAMIVMSKVNRAIDDLGLRG